MFKTYRALYAALRTYRFGQAEWPHIKRGIGLALMYMMIGEGMLFFEAYPLKIFIDDVTTGTHQLKTTLILSAIVLMGYVIHEVTWKRTDKYRFDGMWRNFGLINALGVRHVLKLGTVWHLDHSTAEKESVVSRNHKKIDQLTDEVIFNAVPTTLRITMAVILCMVLDWRFGLIALASPIMYGSVAAWVERKSYPLHEDFRTSIKRVEMSETEASAHAIPIDEQGLVEYFSDKHEQVMIDHTEGEVDRVKVWRQYLGYSVWALGFLRACYYPLAFWCYKSGASVGTIILASSLLERMWSHLYRFMDFSRGMREGMPALRELTEILQTVPAIQADPCWKQPEVIYGGINFSHVHLHYDGADTAALRGVHFSIEPGETVGVIGESGAGKSTMARLIMRLQDPTMGVVDIDGHDLSLCDPEWLRSKVIGYVPQENVLFDTTIGENIRITAPCVSDHEVRTAAKAANIHHFIESLPNGYDTMVGERGLKLSGGQRQRLALARALIKQPYILVLDEPTSALDAQSQEEIKQTLHDLASRGNMTIVIIAHRLSTISMADRVLEMVDGQVADFDTIERLEKSGGVYATMRALEKI